MSAEEARLRAFALQTKIRRNLIVTIVTGFVLLVASAMLIVRQRSWPTRGIPGILIVMIVIIINRAYRSFWSPDTLPDTATSSACVEYYKRELTAQYRSVAVTWRRIVPEVLVFVVILRLSLTAQFRYPWAEVFLPVFWAVVLIGRYWKAHTLRRELQSLGAFEMEDDDAHDTR